MRNFDNAIRRNCSDRNNLNSENEMKKIKISGSNNGQKNTYIIIHKMS